MKKKPVVKIRLNAAWLRVLVLVLFLVQLLDPNKAWVIVLVGFGGLWLLTYVWNRHLARGLRLEREQQYGWLQVGDWLEERFTLRNSSVAPATWVSMEDSSDLPGYSVSLGTGIGGQSERRWMKRTPCERRGEFHLGPLTLKTGDVFGIYSVEIHYPQTDTFVVAPPVIPLPFTIDLMSGRRVDARSSSRIRTEKSISSYSAREYQSGDSFAKIHWMITARHNQPFVRVFENIFASDSWWILLDLDGDAQVGKGDQATDEHSIILAASLADQGLRTGSSVGMVASGEETVIHLAKHGFDHRGEILRTLSLAKRGRKDIADLLAHSQRFLRQYSNILVITSSNQTDWLEKLDLFRSKEITPTVLLVASDQPWHAAQLRDTGRLLAKRGINHHLVTPQVFATPEARPGKQGEVQWKFTPMGRAIMIRSGGGGS